MHLKKSIFYILWIAPFLSFALGYFFTHSFFHAKEILAPNFVGNSLQDALRKASCLGLNIRMLREKIDSDIKEGTILEQIPNPSHTIKPNQYMFVTISKHPRGVIVPEVLGKDQKAMVVCCRDLGIPTQIFWLNSKYPKNFCMAQFPQAGQRLERRPLVSYFSSGRNQFVIVPDLKKKPISHVLEFLDGEGVKVELFHDKKMEKNHKCCNCVVSGQQPMAGSIVDKSKKLYFQLQVSLPEVKNR